MSKPSDQALLEQYRDAGNLNARVRLHERFSTNPYGWHEWVFDQIDLPAEASVLELGCGPGHLWKRSLARIPAGWRVVLSDFSPGMLGDAWRNLGDAVGRFSLAAVDAQAIPFPDGTFDAVLANHMLYHVPDRARTLAEIRRVLRPGGRLYASTVGESHLRELRELIGRFSPGVRHWSPDFTLESGGAEIARHFASVGLRRYEDALVVTEVEPLVSYVLSEGSAADLSAERLRALVEAVESEIAERGAFRIAKDSGLFVARRFGLAD